MEQEGVKTKTDNTFRSSENNCCFSCRNININIKVTHIWTESKSNLEHTCIRGLYLGDGKSSLASLITWLQPQNKMGHFISNLGHASL